MTTTYLLFLSLLSRSILSEVINCRKNFCQCKEKGDCQINCDKEADQCKQSYFQCQAGYPCTILCGGKNSCTDSRIDAKSATDVTLICDGKDACKSSTLNCGWGMCNLECGSDRTACEDIKVKNDNAAGFDCLGYCSNSNGVPRPATPKPTARPSLPPTPPTMRPTRFPTPGPTRAPIEPQILSCKGIATECKCNNAQPCIIKCDTRDSCIDSTLICPRDFDCTLECSDSACIKASVTGPTDSNFDIQCTGTSSCNDLVADSSSAKEVNAVCSGKDSCKGAGTQINCGSGKCNLQFTGEAAGSDATINTNFAVGFKCEGRYAPCPPNYLPPCPAPGATACTTAQVFNQEICQCECPYLPEATNGCPGSQVFNKKTCKCELNCAPGTPTEAQCAAQGKVWRDCACFDSNYCCLTDPVQQDPKQWAGICWGETTEIGCNAEPNQRCIWEPRQCLPNPPRNALNPGQACSFSTIPCVRDSDCCSERCLPDGLCR